MIFTPVLAAAKTHYRARMNLAFPRRAYRLPRDDTRIDGERTTRYWLGIFPSEAN